VITRYCVRLVPVVVLVLFSVLQVRAADFTFYAGGVKPGSIEYHGEEVSLEGGSMFGFRVSTNIVPSFGLEHTFAFSSDFLFPKNVEGPTDAKGIVYNSNLIVSIPLFKVEPYLTAGLGLVHQYGSPDLPVGTEPALNYGGGLKFRNVKGRFGLRFDVRGYRVGFVTNSMNMLEMSGGIMISTD
jgi:hypothetical protein